ncbi:MAG: glycosyltransferase family A protein [Bryobacteraceae bacterium]|jgi:glycosyltransferase involved in cell wall biosynthesis
MSRPQISVVVPLYNKRQTVVPCLQSILAQTERDFELIVVDDGSTDGSGELAATLSDPRLRIVRQENRGESAARNRGIAEARADLIAFLDADDLWMPEFLAAVSSLARQFPEAGLFATGLGRCWLDGRPDLLVGVKSPDGKSGVLVDDYFSAVQEGDFISSSNVCIRRKVLESCGGFLEGEPLGADIELWTRIHWTWPFACHPEVLAWYFTPQNSVHLSRPPTAELPLVVRRQLARLAEESPAPLLAARVRNYTDWQLTRHADRLLWNGEAGLLDRYLKDAPFFSKATARRYRLIGWTARHISVAAAKALRWGPEKVAHAVWPSYGRRRVLDVRRRACCHVSAGISEGARA